MNTVFWEYLNGLNRSPMVADHTAANPLLGLLEATVTNEAKEALADESMQSHLAEALVDAAAVKVNVDDLLKKLKPKLLGFFKGGRQDFESCVAEAMADLLKHEQVAEDDQPWKVE